MTPRHYGPEQPDGATSNHPLSHELGSEGVSKQQTNGRSVARKRNQQCGASKWASCVMKKACGWAHDPILMSRFLVVLNHSARAPQDQIARISRVTTRRAKAAFFSLFFFFHFFSFFVLPVYQAWGKWIGKVSCSLGERGEERNI